MPCYHPLTAYKSLTEKTPAGKAFISFDRKNVTNSPWEKLSVPCGSCIGCRIDRSKQWALRCVHEASMFEHNCFLTLTFSPEHLNELGTLVKSDFQKFMKRLRKKRSGMEAVYVNDDWRYPIRYFHCGEYGSLLERPHHHALLFNFDFADKKVFSVSQGVTLYSSALLEATWEMGFCTVGEVTYQSAAYVARYVTKKVNGMHAGSHYLRGDPDTGEAYYLEPEYITMSRRPGIGKLWFDKFAGDVYPKDFITFDGHAHKSPSYYDNLHADLDPESMAKIKRKRKLAAIEHAEDSTSRRLKSREIIAQQRNHLFVREFEDGT